VLPHPLGNSMTDKKHNCSHSLELFPRLFLLRAEFCYLLRGAIRAFARQEAAVYRMGRQYFCSARNYRSH
jgi:hypothetical protein